MQHLDCSIGDGLGEPVALLAMLPFSSTVVANIPSSIRSRVSSDLFQDLTERENFTSPFSQHWLMSIGSGLDMVPG